MKALKTAETQLREQLEKDGWEVVHKGWPDFACIKDGAMMFVEVKNYKGDMLKKQQHYILTHLAKLGLTCYKWTPNEGFEKISPATPYVEPIKSYRGKHKRLTVEEKFARLSPEEQQRIKDDEAHGIHWYL